MKLTVTINLDNAAFEDNDEEILRILKKVGQFLRGPSSGLAKGDLALYDINGNHVGKAIVTA